jgi:hypothetical protein
MSAEVISIETGSVIPIEGEHAAAVFHAPAPLEVAFTRTGRSVPICEITSGGFSIRATESFTPGSLLECLFTSETGLQIALMARAVAVQPRPRFRRFSDPEPDEGTAGFVFMQLQLPATRKKIAQLLNVFSVPRTVESEVS